jgi:hypothetical protein
MSYYDEIAKRAIANQSIFDELRIRDEKSKTDADMRAEAYREEQERRWVDGEIAGLPPEYAELATEAIQTAKLYTIQKWILENWSPGETRSVLITSPTETGKSIALTMCLIAAIMEKMSVAYISAASIGHMVTSQKDLWGHAFRVPVLALDEFHELMGMPSWIRAAAKSLIDARRGNRLSTIGAATAPVFALAYELRWELIRRFEIRNDIWKPGDPVPEEFQRR